MVLSAGATSESSLCVTPTGSRIKQIQFGWFVFCGWYVADDIKAVFRCNTLTIKAFFLAWVVYFDGSHFQLYQLCANTGRLACIKACNDVHSCTLGTSKAVKLHQYLSVNQTYIFFLTFLNTSFYRCHKGDVPPSGTFCGEFSTHMPHANSMNPQSVSMVVSHLFHFLSCENGQQKTNYNNCLFCCML